MNSFFSLFSISGESVSDPSFNESLDTAFLTNSTKETDSGIDTNKASYRNSGKN